MFFIVYLIDHQLFLVVNNSGKIVVINDETFEYLYQIDNLLSPRKIIKVNNSKYYITDLYSNSIYISTTPTKIQQAKFLLVVGVKIC